MASCGRGYMGALEVRPPPGTDRELAIDIAKRVAEKWRLIQRKEDLRLHSQQNRQALASYRGYFQTKPKLGYSTVNLGFTLWIDTASGTFIYGVSDIDNGRSTHIVEGVVADVRKEIEARLPGAELEFTDEIRSFGYAP